MNAALAQPESLPRRRWLVWVVVVFAAQLGFIVWLGAEQDIAPRTPNSPPPTSLAVNYDFELAELFDPTLFALPNRHGFSGLAWALTPGAEYAAPDWDEPLRWLPLPTEKLGSTFRHLVVDDLTSPLPVAEKPEPQIPALDIAATILPMPARSLLRIEGGIAGRSLLVPLALPSWPNSDILMHSVVRVIVDARGHVVSAMRLEGCGLPEADQKALDLVRTAQFEPMKDGENTQLAHPLAGLSWGKMIFQWHTVAPAPATESSPPP